MPDDRIVGRFDRKALDECYRVAFRKK